MHPAEIQAALKLKGYSQADVAKECEVKPSSVSMVINGRGRSRPIEEKLSQLLGIALGRLWPHWYETPDDAARHLERELTDDERHLLDTYRSLTDSQQTQARAMLEVLRLGGRLADGPSIVVSGGSGQRIAGRDFVTGPDRKR